MTKKKAPSFEQTLQPHFKAICQTLSTLNSLPKSKARQMACALDHCEQAAIALAMSPAAAEQPQTWLRHAAISLSPAVVRAFGSREPTSVHMPTDRTPWEVIAKHASREHLDAMFDAGIDMRSGHAEFLDKALSDKGKDMQAFLEAHIDTIWSADSFFRDLTDTKIARHPEFLARYLAAGKAHHLDGLQWWLGISMRSLDGRDMMILHCLDIEPDNPNTIPDGARGALDNLSSHQQMRIEGWKRDPALLLGDRDALDWAKGLVPTF